MIYRFMLLTGLALLWSSVPAAAQDRNNRRGDIKSANAGRITVMRAGPQAAYPPVRRIQKGQQVQVYGCLNDRSWCDVSQGNDRGWISGRDIRNRYRGQPNSIPFDIGRYWDDHYRQRDFYGQRNRWEQQYFDQYQNNWGPRPDRPHWGSGAINGLVLRTAGVFAGPARNYPRMGTVYAQNRVAIHGCLPNLQWCDVSYRSLRGWVAARSVVAITRGRRQRIDSSSVALGIVVQPFVLRNYWDEHYRSQAFSRDRARWERVYRQNSQQRPRRYRSDQSMLQDYQRAELSGTAQGLPFSAAAQQMVHTRIWVQPWADDARQAERRGERPVQRAALASAADPQ